MSFARSKRANVFAARKVHWTLRLSGSANRGDFSRIMQLEIVDSHDALSEKVGRRAIVAIMTYACININRKQQNMIYAT